ncbi:sialidase family protein [Prosthecobacter sp.]|uniref:sialidase family protein n=1 Tax=Prosthecobacter sp. TaxID=1965333 RepID=UPI001D664EE4|nr:sialidase family protein [Prosthecobacter sp.]MCB1278848.1 exo-alpha-sialidase [Prosthecobacter sp.]
MTRQQGITAILGVVSSWSFAAELPPLLDLPGTGGDANRINFEALPVLKGEHAVVCPYDETWKFQLHNYLLRHDGKFWCMWSAGPEVEDFPTQHVRYATSDDGLHWNAPKNLTGMPAEGRAFIARDFWLRDGELLGLAASYKGHGAFGVDKDLQLVAYTWNKSNDTWTEKGVLYQDAINNFSPQKISTGEWMMTRRDARFNVTMLFGGVKSLSDWRAVPVVDRLKAVRTSKFSPDEPVCWEQPDGTLIAAIRDNGGSGMLYRTVSHDHGATWSEAVITNYPNATSKLFTLQTSRGYRVLVSNANPRIGRREMHLAVSDDGVTFTRMMRLDIPSPKATTFQYPHVMEHDGSLFIAFSNKKNVTELLKVKLDDIEKTVMPTSVGLDKPLPPITPPPASAASDWIDLGNEGETLYLAAELTVPKRGQTARLGLSTSSGLERVVIGVDAAGKLTARIQPGEAKGPELKEGETMSLLVRIVGHQTTPDELFVQTGPAGAIPAEPKDGAWTLSNSKGNTQANLAIATTTSSAFKNVRVASTYAALAKAKPIEVVSMPGGSSAKR